MTQTDMDAEMGAHTSAVTASAQRDSYIRLKCREAFGMEEPLVWLAKQLLADTPDLERWHALLFFKVLQPEDFQWAELLHRFGFRLPVDSSQELRGARRLLVSLMDPGKAQVYEAAQVGSHFNYYVIPRDVADTLLYISDSYYKRVVWGERTLDTDDLRSLLEATVLRAWNTPDCELRFEAREFICLACSAAIRQQCLGWSNDFDKTTIACLFEENGCVHGPWAFCVNLVVVWDILDGKVIAELFPGERFKGASFDPGQDRDMPVAARIRLTYSTLEQMFYDTERRFFTRRRNLESLIRRLAKEAKPLSIVSCKDSISDFGAFGQAIFVRRSALKDPNISRGTQLLPRSC